MTYNQLNDKARTMKFTVNSPISTKAGKIETFVKVGSYPVVRFFDDKRIIINISAKKSERRLAIVGLSLGILTNET